MVRITVWAFGCRDFPKFEGKPNRVEFESIIRLTEFGGLRLINLKNNARDRKYEQKVCPHNDVTKYVIGWITDVVVSGDSYQCTQTTIYLPRHFVHKLFVHILSP